MVAALVFLSAATLDCSNGILLSGMPAAKEIFRDEEIWQLVLYIRIYHRREAWANLRFYGGSPEPTKPNH